jgi:hypothetical protein
LPGAASTDVIVEKLGLTSLKNRQWAIFKTSALKGDGNTLPLPLPLPLNPYPYPYPYPLTPAP